MFAQQKKVPKMNFTHVFKYIYDEKKNSSNTIILQHGIKSIMFMVARKRTTRKPYRTIKEKLDGTKIFYNSKYLVFHLLKKLYLFKD